MSEVPIYPERLPVPGRRRLAVVEACLGLFATFFLGFAPPVIGVLGGLVLFVHEQYWLTLGVAVLVLLTGLIAVHVVSLASDAMKELFPDQFARAGQLVMVPVRPQSFAVRMGTQMRPLPVLVRLFACLWFLAHFVMGATIALAMHKWLGNSLANPGTLITVVFPLVLHAAFILGTNVYLVLAVSVFTNDETALEAVWRKRFAIDILMTLFYAAVSML